MVPDPILDNDMDGTASSSSLAASSVCFKFALMASLWDDRSGAAEFEASHNFSDAVKTRLGRGTDEQRLLSSMVGVARLSGSTYLFWWWL